jgi:hypothetical protein
MGELDQAENIAMLVLIVIIGYGLYKFSDSFSTAIDNVLGISTDTNAATAPAGYGGTYTNAANQVVTNPLMSIETILGMNQSMPTGNTQPATAGSAVVTTGGGSAF